MSPTDASFEIITGALRSLYPGVADGSLHLERTEHTLVLRLPTDVAGFSVFNGSIQSEFEAAYGEFKHLYREHYREWDSVNLSFVLCRHFERADEDLFYASLEHDPLFCRKYVIRAFDDAERQREELLRLPFLPLPDDGRALLRRPQSAQDLLQAAGLSASLARKLIEAGHRSPERIVADLREGSESLPVRVERPAASRVTLTKPRTYSKLVSATIEGFRAFRKSQDFELDGSVIVLYGPNGLGKTSFFDAIDFACTGRIGRLCRHQQRNQADFSRLATHLDKTPGTGSVVLKGRNERDGQTDDWVLKRGTGDWSRAWIDDEERDRKAVLSFLTHANWLEAKPRQQTYESLFRATHLFGQDEQELLIEFRKASVIPEAFISEMLALQDYSQGLTKVKSVVAQLGTDLRQVTGEIETLGIQIEELSTSIAGSTAEDSEAAIQPIDALVHELRGKLMESDLSELFPEGNASLEMVEQLSEIVTAQLRGAEERQLAATTLADQLPGFQRLLDEARHSEVSLAEVDQLLEALGAEERERAARIVSQRNLLTEQDVEHRKQNERRRDLEGALEGLGKRAEIAQRSNVLREELGAQVATRNALDKQLGETEPALSKALVDHASSTQTLEAARATVKVLERAIDAFVEYEGNRAAASDAVARITSAEESLRRTEGDQREAEERLREAKATSEALRPAYEQAISTQTELEQLLDSIQSHVHDERCPLCGSAFESAAALLERIQQQRFAMLSERDVTARYKASIKQEAEVTTQLESISATGTSMRQYVNDLRSTAERCRGAMTAYEDGLRTILGDHSGELAKGVLLTRLNVAQQSLNDALEAATVANRGLDDLQEATRGTTAIRESVRQRVAELEASVEALSDENRKVDLLIGSVLQRETTTEDELGALADQVMKGIDATVAARETLQREVNEEDDQLVELKKRTTEATGRRNQLLATIQNQRKTANEFKSRLERVGATEEIKLADLLKIASESGSRAATMGDLLDRQRAIAGALRARERRLELDEKRNRLAELNAAVAKLEAARETIEKSAAGCRSVERLLGAEREAAIESHIGAYGPLITTIQQRLRSVYGFGGVQLKARGGEAAVEVEWRNKSVQVPPTDFFSDSQKQILMLSIFLAGGLRQNWSGFAPVLLDDPVTHFDDLNAYGFIELVRGIISSHSTPWQFIISTCEERLFALMQKKFERVAGGAVFYEYLGMTEGGPMIQRR